jgi:hypothetical protein
MKGIRTLNLESLVPLSGLFGVASALAVYIRKRTRSLACVLSVMHLLVRVQSVRVGEIEASACPVLI